MSVDLSTLPTELLQPYAEAVKEFQVASNEYDEALKTIAPAKEALDEKRKGVQEIVDQGMPDVFKVLKGTRASSGERKPRNPENKQKVLDAISGDSKALAEIVKETGLERPYIMSTLTAAIKKGTVTSEGERGSKRYTYVGEQAAEPVAA